jgi:hypothetical protein
MRGQAKILNWMAKLKIYISNYKWIQNKKKIQENEDQIKKKKIIDLRMKLKINWNLIKGLIIKIRNQNIEGQILNIIKFWIEWKIKKKITKVSKT